MTIERPTLDTLVNFFSEKVIESLPYLESTAPVVLETTFTKYEKRFGVDLRGVLPLPKDHPRPDVNNPSSIEGLACPLNNTSI